MIKWYIQYLLRNTDRICGTMFVPQHMRQTLYTVFCMQYLVLHYACHPVYDRYVYLTPFIWHPVDNTLH